MKQATAFVALALIAGGCKSQPQIMDMPFPELASVASVCKDSGGKGVHRLVSLQLSNDFNLVHITFNPCRSGSSGFGLADNAGGAASKPLIIWAPQYGTGGSDKLVANSTSALSGFKANGYQVLDATNMTGPQLQQATATFKGQNPDAESAMVVTHGHGEVLPTQTDAAGSASMQHYIDATNTDGKTTRYNTNADILQPALSGLGLPPKQVTAVVSSCYSGQAACDYHKTTPDSPIVTSSSSSQVSWQTPDDKGTEQMLTALTQVSNPGSKQFTAADANGDAKLSTNEFKDYLNTNGGGLAVLQQYNVLYRGADGQPNANNPAYVKPVIDTQTVQTAGPESTLFSGEKTAGSTLENQPLTTMSSAKQDANGAMQWADKSGIPYTTPEVVNNSGQVVGWQAIPGTTSSQGQRPFGAEEPSTSTGESASKAAANSEPYTAEPSFGDAGEGNWGLPANTEYAPGDYGPTEPTGSAAGIESAPSAQEGIALTASASGSVKQPAKVAKKPASVIHRPTQLAPKQMLLYFKP